MVILEAAVELCCVKVAGVFFIAGVVSGWITLNQVHLINWQLIVAQTV